jgi:hypothetical protein
MNYSVARIFTALGFAMCVTFPTGMVIVALSGKPIRIEHTTPTSSWVAEINMNSVFLPSQFNPTDEQNKSDEILIASFFVP